MTDRQAWQRIKRKLRASHDHPHMDMSICCEIMEVSDDDAQCERLKAQLRRHRPRWESRIIHSPYWWAQNARGYTARLRVCDRILARPNHRRAKGKR